MTGTVLILGANGRFGRAATHAFANEGWSVRAASRKGDSPAARGVHPIACDVTDREAVIAAAEGVDVIVHAVHPLYHQWAQIMPVHTRNVIAAGLASDATVMISGNVYVFGDNPNQPWHEDMRPTPISRKGALRVTMERSFADAAEQGLRTIILRGGDFIEGIQTGNWFENYIVNKAHKGKFTYPGKMDQVHAWAYLPDMARAMAQLAAIRADLPPFAAFGFEGYSLTGEELKAAVSRVVGQPLKTGKMPWGIMRVMGLFNPLVREVLEMRYLWDTPHRLDGDDLRAALPDFQPTPLATAMTHCVMQSGGADTVARVPRSA